MVQACQGIWKYLLLLLLCVAWSATACQCGPPVQPDGSKPADGVTPGDGVGPGDGGPNPRDGVAPGEKANDGPEVCPPSWTEKMTSTPPAKPSAVFCPPPTITGCHRLRTGPKCEVADVPLIVFLYDATTKMYEVQHSGSIEGNTHGELKPGADATKPDQILKLPAGVKITAMFSGVPTSFQFKGEEVTVFEPK